jgi:hypothetical protein
VAGLAPSCGSSEEPRDGTHDGDITEHGDVTVVVCGSTRSASARDRTTRGGSPADLATWGGSLPLGVTSRVPITAFSQTGKVSCDHETGASVSCEGGGPYGCLANYNWTPSSSRRPVPITGVDGVECAPFGPFEHTPCDATVTIEGDELLVSKPTPGQILVTMLATGAPTVTFSLSSEGCEVGDAGAIPGDAPTADE